MIQQNSEVLGMAELLPRPQDIRLESLDHIPVDMILGREGEYPAVSWVEAHENILDQLRVHGEVPLGALYRRNKCLAGVGVAQPYRQEEYSHLSEYVQDTPFTALVHVGDATLPTEQKERYLMMRDRIATADRVMFVMGGLMETRLAVEGIATEIANGMPQPEGLLVITMTHSGGERSYLPGADLSHVDWKTELETIRAGMRRILTLYGKKPEQVVGIVGHSKLGFQAEQVANTGEYPEAAIVEIAPLIIGKRPYREWAPWLQTEETRKPHVAVQMGLYSSLIDLALILPENAFFDAAVKLLGDPIAEHFVGNDAANKEEAIAVIVHELLRNKAAIRAQRRALVGMPTIVSDPSVMSDNPRYVVAAGRDNTLEWVHQKRWEEIVFARQAHLEDLTGLHRAAKMSRISQHNIHERTLQEVVGWMYRQQMKHLGLPDPLDAAIEPAAPYAFKRDDLNRIIDRVPGSSREP